MAKSIMPAFQLPQTPQDLAWTKDCKLLNRKETKTLVILLGSSKFERSFIIILVYLKKKKKVGIYKKCCNPYSIQFIWM